MAFEERGGGGKPMLYSIFLSLEFLFYVSEYK
jgi:hypothetical protein